MFHNLAIHDFYKVIFELSDLAIFIFEVIEEQNHNSHTPQYKYKFILTNTTHQKLTGITLDEIQNKFLWDLETIIPKEQLQTINNRYDLCSRGKKQIEYEEEILIKNQMTYWYTKLIPIIQDDKVKIIIGMSIDISKLKSIQKQLEERNYLIENLLRNSPIGIAVTNEDIHIIYYNEKFLKIWNLDHNIIKDDKKVFLKIVKQIKNRNIVYPKIKKIIESRKKGIIKYLRLNKKYIQMEIYPFFFFKDNNEKIFAGYLGIYVDKTKEYFQEKQLQKALKEAQIAYKTKTDFLATVSHELRTPLTTIIGLTDLIKQSNKDPEIQNYVQMIDQSANYLLNLVQDILDLSSFELKSKKIEEKPFLLYRPIELLINSYKFHCNQKNLQFVFTTDINEFPIVISDEKRLYQIINNLLSNALKFTRNGRIDLRLFKENEDEDFINIVIEVEDTGIGISEEDLPYIFKKFKKLDEFNINPQGIGIGLSLVKEIISLMGGNIQVDSKLGEGTKFQVHLSLRKQKAIKPLNLETLDIDEIINQFKPKLENKKILIAEDTIDIQFIIKKFLGDLNVKFDIVSNGIEALHKIHQNSYDLILLDIRMPVMDGISTFIQIPDHIKKTTPIAALTAFSMEEDIKKTKEVGFIDHIIKPIKKKEFILKIIQLLVNKK